MFRPAPHSQKQLVQRRISRWFHASTSTASSKTSTTSRDTRLAGRLRFYKQVGVQPVQAPWESSTLNERTIESPISAGVDGTDSASGIHHPNGSKATIEDILTPRLPGTHTSPETETKWFGLTLDGRTLKTPGGQTLAVPSETLAYMIGAEWDAQETNLQPANMPLMTLACTALDQAAFHPDVYREQSMRFLPTDTTCFWADPTEDRVLHRRQEEAWKDLHEFATEKLGDKPACAYGPNEAMLMSRIRAGAKPTAGLPHPPQVVETATQWTHSLDAWNLVAFSSMCSQAKSFLVSWAMLEPGSPMQNVEKAIEASRVEEEFQISNWGMVEGGHDYDRLNCSIQLLSARLFANTILHDNNLLQE